MHSSSRRFIGAFGAALTICALAGCPRGEKNAPKKGAESPVKTVAYARGPFEDVTASAGIRFQHTNGDAGGYLFPETFGGGCAFLDYDGDGFQDVLLLSCGSLDPSKRTSPNLALYHNNGDGTFNDVTAGSGLEKPLSYCQALAVGDYDNDGKPDIFVAGYGGCFLFHNESSGSAARFRDVTEQAGVGDRENGDRWGSGAAFADYDHDGRLDLVLVHYAVWSPKIDRACPRPDGSRGYCVPTVYDGDSIRLFHNEGNGRFKDVSASAGLASIRGRALAVAWFDSDGDGYDDIYVANDLNRNYLLRNNRNGTFKEIGESAGVAFGSTGRIASGMGIAFGDYDHTGRESLFVPNIKGEKFSLYHAEPEGIFTYVSDEAGVGAPTLYHTGWGTAFIDVDRDGWADLVATNGMVSPYVANEMTGLTYEESGCLFRNTGRGALDLVGGGALDRPRAGRALAAGDFDNDGRPDLLLVNRDSPAELLRNVSPDKNHWIGIRLEGRKSNRDAAGAKVWVTAGGVRQYAECRLGSSYGSSCDKRLHFGLGTAAKLDRLEVQWPSGANQSFGPLEVDRYVHLIEGGAPTADTPVRGHDK